MEIDFSKLQEKVQEQKDEHEFYRYGIILALHLRLNEYLTIDDLVKKYPTISFDFLEAISRGEMPSNDEINATDISDLDVFIQESLYCAGMCIGVIALFKYGGEENKDYVRFLLDAQKDDEFFNVVRGFAALTLAMNSPPSGLMLSRMFPKTSSKEFNELSTDLIAELNGDLVKKFIATETEGLEGFEL